MTGEVWYWIISPSLPDSCALACLAETLAGFAIWIVHTNNVPARAVRLVHSRRRFRALRGPSPPRLMHGDAFRLGLLSDLHFDLAGAPRRWIGWYDAAGVADRVQRALSWFVEENVELVVVAGDVVEAPAARDIDAAFGALTSAGLPVAMVGGNHDWDTEERVRDGARRHGVRLLDEDPFSAAVDVVGIAAAPLRSDAGQFAATPRAADEAPHIVVSHYPLLSEAERLADAGLPYPGDLTNRGELLARMQRSDAPTVVLSGHIHARATQPARNILQLSCGAVIEPPHDAAVVAVADSLREVTRTVRRLGPAGAQDPVFAPECERWSWSGAGWSTFNAETARATPLA